MFGERHGEDGEWGVGARGLRLGEQGVSWERGYCEGGYFIETWDVP